MSETMNRFERDEALKAILKEDKFFMRKNNRVFVIGTLEENIELNHIAGIVVREAIYETTIAAKRLSGTIDKIQLYIAEKKIPEELKVNAKGQRVKVYGEFRSYNVIGTDGKNHLKLRLLVNRIETISDLTDEKDANIIYLRGAICILPFFKQTPLGRNITELHLAVSRNENRKTDYIPCIAWNHNAWLTGEKNVGEMLTLYGRIQSRTYSKLDEEKGCIYRTINEVSINEIQI